MLRICRHTTTPLPLALDAFLSHQTSHAFAPDVPLIGLEIPNQIQITRYLADRLAPIPDQSHHLRLVLRRELPARSFLHADSPRHLRLISGVHQTGAGSGAMRLSLFDVVA